MDRAQLVELVAENEALIAQNNILKGELRHMQSVVETLNREAAINNSKLNAWEK